MRLLEKLRRIAAPAPAAAASTGSSAPEVPGALTEGALGRFWLRTERFPLGHAHGHQTLGEVCAAPVSALATVARDRDLRDADLSRTVFFDTETTSLGGGVGTYVFLLGAGYFRGGEFVVEQYFLRDITEERALLDAINARLGSFDLAVSFHGKGFDAPRLKDRLAFHRMSLALPRRHLDLCLVGRTLYRGAFGDCRLQTFERELVGFRRADDLPGAECPQAYFSHLRGDSRLIPRVFEHNLYDVLTLPAVAARFASETLSPQHPVVLANLGAFQESEGDDRAARQSYAAALDGLRVLRHALLPRAMERLALLERRAGRHAESAAILRERAEIPPFAVEPFEDLAKYFEHRARDLDRAEAVTADALSRVLTGRIPLDAISRERWRRELSHRLDRLERRRDTNS